MTVEYGDPPRCRTDEDGSFICRNRPTWVVYTVGRDGESYIDHVCSRHLPAFLLGWLGHGQSATIVADYGYGGIA